MTRTKAFFFSCLFFYGSLAVWGQGKYQSLMWKVTGNNLERPSYLYGTMHISGKMVFHLGDQFYHAMEKVDVVALELEPEAWLKAIFDEREVQLNAQYDGNWDTDDAFGMDDESPLPSLKGFFQIDMDTQGKVKDAMMYDPALLNYLLFRYNDSGYSADFEENTWLDMFIYQSGKKLGKQTIGLETYAQSDYYIKKARFEERNESNARLEYDDVDFERMQELQKQFEPAYRREDLDLIDSLNKLTVSAAFNKYILIERNKVFVQTIDSVLRSGKSMLAGMGCAHLPGNEGIIELLRAIGYNVEPFNKGERDTKHLKKLDQMVFKHEYFVNTTLDDKITFNTPAIAYHLGASNLEDIWISLDIPNAASFIVQRIKTYSAITQKDQYQIQSSIDSILYEVIAGDIVSQKLAEIEGCPAMDILNKSRRGDYQRRLVIVIPDEIVILKLISTGEKVKNGYGDQFFDSFKWKSVVPISAESWTSPDGLISARLPGSVTYYPQAKGESSPTDFEVSANANGDFYLLQRHTIEDPDFLDEDVYELNRLADAFMLDNDLKLLCRANSMHSGLSSLKVSFTEKSGRKVFSEFILQNLNYCAFSVFTDDSLRAKEFFKSISFTRRSHSDFSLYRDSMMCFEALMPFIPPKIAGPNDFDNQYYSRNDKKNPYLGKIDHTEMKIPEESDVISISFQRYHFFSDGEDSLKFISDRKNIINNGDLKFDKEEITWNKNGCVMNFILSDTATSRKYWDKVILYNKSIYSLHASFDSILGPGDFISNFYDSFSPTDTVFPYYHFVNRDQEFINALVSEDSTSRADAADMVSEMDFSKEAGASIRELLGKMPVIENENDRKNVKEKLTLSLFADTSSQNIAFISSEFYKNADSALYQIDLLDVLVNMRTKAAWNTYGKLLLDEPPIVSGNFSASGFRVLMDSLELSCKMIPDLLPLLALDEYQEDAYLLIATCLDSNFIKSSVYKNEIDQIAMEAKNELKRINASKESSPYYDNSTLMNYCALLFPFKDNPNAKVFFERAHKVRKNSVLLDVIEFDFSKKLVVPDSIIQKISADQNQVIALYKVLHKYGMDNRFPEKLRTREALIKQYILNKSIGRYNSETNVDSVDVVSKGLYNIRGNKLDVYFCKFKKLKSKQWTGVILAFEAEDEDNLWPRYIEATSTVVLDLSEDENEEFNISWKLLEAENRKRRNFQTEATKLNYNWR